MNIIIIAFIFLLNNYSFGNTRLDIFCHFDRQSTTPTQPGEFSGHVSADAKILLNSRNEIQNIGGSILTYRHDNYSRLYEFYDADDKNRRFSNSPIKKLRLDYIPVYGHFRSVTIDPKVTQCSVKVFPNSIYRYRAIYEESFAGTTSDDIILQGCCSTPPGGITIGSN